MSAIRVLLSLDGSTTHPLGIAIVREVGDAQPVCAVQFGEVAALGLIADLVAALKSLHEDARETIDRAGGINGPGGEA